MPPTIALDTAAVHLFDPATTRAIATASMDPLAASSTATPTSSTRRASRSRRAGLPAAAGRGGPREAYLEVAGPARGGEGAPRPAERLRLRQRRHAGRPGRAPGRFKAIVMVDPEIGRRGLGDGWMRPGRSGSGFNLVSHRPDALAGPAAARLLARLKELGWYAQVFADDAQWPEVAPVLRKRREGTGRPFRGPGRRHGRRRAGFQAVLRLGRAGRAAVSCRRHSAQATPPPSTRTPRRCSRPSAWTAASGARTGRSSIWRGGRTTVPPSRSCGAGCRTRATARASCGTIPCGCSASGEAS